MASAKFRAILQELCDEHERELLALKKRSAHELQMLKEQVQELNATTVCMDSYCSANPDDVEMHFASEAEKSEAQKSSTKTDPKKEVDFSLAPAVISSSERPSIGPSMSDGSSESKLEKSPSRASKASTMTEGSDMLSLPAHMVSMLFNHMHTLPQLVWHDSWELYFAIAISCNAVYIGFRVEYLASAGKEHWGESVVRLGFCIFFVFELFLRLYATRCSFFSGRDRWWNIFDVVVVSCMATEEFLRRAFGDSDITDKLAVLTVLRLLRIMRILRATRLLLRVSGKRGFPHGRLLLVSISKALRFIFWLLLSFLALVYMLSLILADVAVDRCVHDSPHSSFCPRFGSVWRSVSTVYQAFVGALVWGELFDPLNDLGWGYTALFVVFISFFSLFMVQIYIGVFVYEVQRAGELLKSEDFHLEHKEHREKFISIMMSVFKRLDVNENGALSLNELKEAFKHKVVSAQLAKMEVDVVEAEHLFELLDHDGSGQVSASEFVLGCLRLQGKAKSIELEKVKKLVEQVDNTVCQISEQLRSLSWESSSIKTKSAKGGKSKAKIQGPDPPSSASAAAKLASSSGTSQSAFSLTTSLYVAEKIPTRRQKLTRSIQTAEMRAMLLSELEDIMVVIETCCEKEMWTDMLSGNALTPQTVNLYHFNHYIMSPQTSAEAVILKGLINQEHEQYQTLSYVGEDGKLLGEAMVLENTHGSEVRVKMEKGQIVVSKGSKIINDRGNSCGTPAEVINEGSVSYKELVSATPAKPDWFCCHWWGEPISEFVRCCQEHGRLRKKNSYWVCAYANRQHDLAGDVEDPESSSFRRAMRLAEGVLLMLDPKAVPFSRIWCGFELYTTVSDPLKMLDIITHRSKPRLMTEDALPSEGLLDWRSRESKFPVKLLTKGLQVKLEDGSATVPSDKQNILKSMGRDKSTGLFDEDLMNSNILAANCHLRSRMAVAAWPQALKEGKVDSFDVDGTPVSLVRILKEDESRTSLHLNLSCVDEATDHDVQSVGLALPPNLSHVSLSFDTCAQITDGGVSALALSLSPLKLRELFLDFGGCNKLTDVAIRELAARLPPSLVELRLVFAFCPYITKAGVQDLADKLPGSVSKLKLTFKGTKYDEAFDSVSQFKRTFKGFFASKTAVFGKKQAR